jgi:hypothetical protein
MTSKSRARNENHLIDDMDVSYEFIYTFFVFDSRRRFLIKAESTERMKCKFQRGSIVKRTAPEDNQRKEKGARDGQRDQKFIAYLSIKRHQRRKEERYSS